MSIPITLILSMAAGLGGAVAKKYYIDKEPSGLSGGLIYNAVNCLSAAAVLLCWDGVGEVSAFTAAFGVIFGALTALQGVTNVLAMKIGPMSYTSVIISFSTLISALSGVMLFGESIGWAQVVGIVLMLASFVLAARGDGADKRANAKWLFLCIIAFLANGGIGVMQKVYRSTEYGGELSAFLIIAFLSSTIFCTIFALALRRGTAVRESGARDGNNKKRVWLMLAVMAVGGICVAVNNKFNLYLSGVMDSAVFFPIVNGGGLVLSTLAAVILFKERLSKKQWAGIALGIASVVFLCNPFG